MPNTGSRMDLNADYREGFDHAIAFMHHRLCAAVNRYPSPEDLGFALEHLLDELASAQKTVRGS